MNFGTVIVKKEEEFFLDNLFNTHLFLELEDLVKSYEEIEYLANVIMVLPEKEVNYFLERLDGALKHIDTFIKTFKEWYSEDVSINGLVELYDRGKKVIDTYKTIEPKIHYPSRFRDIGA